MAFNECTNLESITIKNPACEIYNPYDSGYTISNDYNPCFNGTIYGYENSTAQAYAEKYGYAFALIDNTSEIISGDVNNDNVVSISDIVIIQKCLVNAKDFEKPDISVLDVNKGGKFNVFDLVIVKRMLLC